MTECPFRCGWSTESKDEMLAHLREHSDCSCGGELVEREHEDGSFRCLRCGKRKKVAA